MKETIIRFINEQPTKKISYATFIEKALYDEEQGYYMTDRKKLGKEGDFYTSATLHPIFAKVFVQTFLDIIEKENMTYTICEIGGGDGRFAKAFLEEWEELSPTTFKDGNYLLIEESPFHRKCQYERVGHLKQVQQFSCLQEAMNIHKQYQGIIFSNELLDAFPVHVVQQRELGLQELFVTVNDEANLIETEEPCENEELLQWITDYGPPLQTNQKIEVPLAMNHWLKSISDWMTKGVVMTIDYGYTKSEWQQPERMDGSLRGYHQHQLINNPLLYPGEMDITSHIHLDALIDIGKEVDLETCLFTTQDRFLLSCGLLSYLQENHDPNPFSEKSKQNRVIRSLISDSGMSKAFHVIVQTKNANQTNNYPWVGRDPYKI
ncbi:class I SAM-dependent methyltransferase [Bacillus sp. FJAT-45350]|uniref:class I SAM-dependent methyltransferase n=1 Tax=Bacillus sp. FJAT-45350 TaxID=2011014 RepID=UPI000BB9ABE6|nr:SAM-dependent methyltransferase [Bacillus sp. FJAT-45350]